MAEDLEKQLRLQKIETVKSLVSHLILIDKEKFNDFTIADDKTIAYYDAMIDILNKQITNAKASEPKLIRFDQLEQERENLTKEELKTFKKSVKRQDKLVDSYLASLEPRCTLKGQLYTANCIVHRYRGNGVGDEFSKKYPLGVLM